MTYITDMWQEILLDVDDDNNDTFREGGWKDVVSHH